MKTPFQPEISEEKANAKSRPRPQCAFTIDVEDWYQSSVDFDAPISERVVRNVQTLLGFLDERRVKASFFVQGLVARRFPRLIEAIQAEGHEIQSHGHTHRPLYGMDRAALRVELELARKAVEDACGAKVTAFRAPDFSILEGNLWALEVLAESGFKIDSSIFPLRMKRYGISGFANTPHTILLANGLSILEAPVAVWTLGKLKLPIAGGGYFRLLPRLFLELAIGRMLARGDPVTIYCHPYEFNPRELDEASPEVPRMFVFKQKLGRASMISRLNALFKRYSFGRFDDLLDNWSAK